MMIMMMLGICILVLEELIMMKEVTSFKDLLKRYTQVKKNILKNDVLLKMDEKFYIKSAFDDLLGIIKIISKVPPKERESVLTFSDMISKRLRWNSYESLIDLVVNQKKLERENMCFYVSKFFDEKKLIDTYCVSECFDALFRVSDEERTQLFKLAKEFVNLHKHERQATELAKKIDEVRKNGFGFGNLIAVPQDEGNDRNLISFMNILSKIPKNEREGLLKQTEDFLRKNSEKEAITVLESLVDIPYQERSSVIYYTSLIFKKGETSARTIIEKDRAIVFHLAKQH